VAHPAVTVTLKFAVSPIAVAVNVVEPPELACPLMRNGSEKAAPARIVVLPGNAISAVDASSVTVTVDDIAGVMDAVQYMVLPRVKSGFSHESASLATADVGVGDLTGFLLGEASADGVVAARGVGSGVGVPKRAKLGNGSDAPKSSTLDFG